MPDAFLSQQEKLRYSRHLLLPEVGVGGQERLKAARVLVIGAGGLGSPIILYLAAAGVGTIGIVDFDSVEVSNLQRQILYIDEDLGAPKVVRAAERAHSLNPEIKIESHNIRLASDNTLELFEQYDIVIDGTDNFATRYLVNDACVLLKKPNIYGSIFRFEGQASVFVHDGAPCYRCLFPEPPAPDVVPNCAEGGVLGVMAGVIGCIQASEALKLIIGCGQSLAGQLLLYDALNMSIDKLTLLRSTTCPVCGPNPTITKLEDNHIYCAATLPSVQNIPLVNATHLKEEMKSESSPIILDVRTPEEVAQSCIEGSIHIPLAQLPERLQELDKNSDIVTYCKSGVRSQKAAQLLSEHGFERVRSLEGGIEAW